MTRSLGWLGVAGISAGLLVGCRTETTQDGNGEKVKVATPFGGLQVRTNEAAAESGMGVPVYPGATLITKENDKDKNNGAADINLSFGSMRLRVKVLSYRTTDAPDSVRTFYHKELGRFGTVIACQNDHAVGQPTRTPEGLTCDKGKNDHAPEDVAGSGAYELKAGSEEHQHTVAIQSDDRGTKFALVMVDLPKHFTLGDSDDEKRPSQ